MRYILVIDETSFYHPDLTKKLLSIKDYQCVGCLLVKGTSKQNSLIENIKDKLVFFGFSEIAKFIVRYLGLLFKPHLRSVIYHLRKNKIDYLKIKSDTDVNEIIGWIREKDCDFIFASTTLILNKEILGLPRYGCIGRHSSLLPSYAGFWPIFHATLNGDKEIGVTLYLMSEKIDQGKILAQKQYMLDSDKSLDQLYQENFSYVTDIFKEAVANLIERKFRNENGRYVSFFHFPEGSRIKYFRRLGGKFL
jgi:folate-dependent phosphoribosylglycinamide formyltransferase PurN